MTPRFARVFGALGACIVASATPSAAADTVSPSEVRVALARAGAAMRAIAKEGGYLWRYSPDLRVRAGEDEATATQVWVQAPGTPAVGAAFLRAWEVTGDSAHLEAARSAALALVRGQLESGGWGYLIEFDPEQRTRWRYRGDAVPVGTATTRRRNLSTYDDDTTQYALRYLLEFLDAARAAPDPADETIRAALDYGLRKLVEAQYPNGGWPQRWDGAPHDPAAYPVIPASVPREHPREHTGAEYHRHYTLNDGAHRDCVRTLLEAARRTGRAEYREAALRGAEFLLLAQLPEPQAGWAQQYDARMHPAWARAFEPPAVSAAESAGAMDLLLDVYAETGDTRLPAAVGRAADWLRRSTLAPGRWARLYELETNRPIYGDRDGRIHHDLTKISEERRRGYAWEGGFGIEAVLERHRALAAGEPARVARGTRAADARHVRAVIDALDAEGRWLTPRHRPAHPEVATWIETAEFVRNVRMLCDFIAAGSQRD